MASSSSNSARLRGGKGDDLLQGGPDDDFLDGRQGDDTLFGAAGSDIFRLSRGDDVILDFTSNRVLLDFEGITTGASAPLNGYMGLVWTQSAVAMRPPEPPLDSGGFGAVLTSGDYVLSDVAGGGLGFSDPSADFDLVSGFFAAAVATGVPLVITAVDDGERVGSTMILIGDDKTSIDFINHVATGDVLGDVGIGGRFTSIDSVFINGLGTESSQLAIDDLVLRYEPGTHGDRIDVQGRAQVADLLASAQSDGEGGTVLTHAGGTVTLVGVAPQEVTADLFV